MVLRMSKSVNSVFLLGRLGQDPRISETKSGTKIAKLSIATTESYKDKDGNWKERTEWHNRVVAFHRLADILQEYAKKGDQIHVEARVHYSEYEDKESGRKIQNTDFVVKEIVLLGNKRGSAEANPVDGGTPAAEYGEGELDEIPF
jgi:single-strand DNA-binding protein